MRTPSFREFRPPRPGRPPTPAQAVRTLRRKAAAAQRERRERTEAAARVASIQSARGTVRAVRDGVVSVAGNRHRAILAVRGKRWSSTPEVDRDTILAYHGWFVNSLPHPIQWTVLNRGDALDAMAGALVADLPADFTDEARAVAHATAARMREEGKRRNCRQRRYYVTIPADSPLWDEAKAELNTRAANTANALNAIRLSAARLDDDGICVAERDCWYPDVPRDALVPDDIAPAGDAIAPDADAYWIEHGDGTGHWVRAWKLTRWPKRMADAWLAPLVTSNVGFDLGIHVTPLDPDLYADLLKQRRKRHGTAIGFLTRKNLPLWDGLQEAYRQTAALEQTIRTDESVKPFLASVTVLINAPDAVALERLTERAERDLKGAGGKWMRCTKEHHLAARTVRPEGVDALASALEADTGTIIHLLPALTESIGNEDAPTPVLKGFDGDEAIGVPQFDARTSVEGEINAGEIIVAPSGGGKSVRLKWDLFCGLCFGCRAAVFDVEGEYDPLVALFGGRDVVPGRADSVVNPFAFTAPAATTDAANPVRSQTEFLIGLLELALAPKTGLPDKLVTAADKAIMDTYAAQWTRSDGVICGLIDPDNPDTWHRPAPWLACLGKTLAKSRTAAARELCEALARYVTGSRAGLFGEATTVAFDRPFVRFDYRALEEAVRPLAVYLGLTAVWAEQVRRRTPCLVDVDEAWQYFALPQTAKQFEKMALRGRKYGFGYRFVFHNAEQFPPNSSADQVRQTAAAQTVMRQTAQSIAGVARLWDLGERAKQALLAAEKGTALVYTSKGHALAKLDLTGWPVMPYFQTGLQASSAQY